MSGQRQLAIITLFIRFNKEQNAEIETIDMTKIGRINSAVHQCTQHDRMRICNGDEWQWNKKDVYFGFSIQGVTIVGNRELKR